MEINVERMKRRNEKLKSDAKRLEFDALANSAMEDKKRRFSPSKQSRPRISRSTVACALLVVLFIFAVSCLWRFFKPTPTPTPRTSHETIAKTEGKVLREPIADSNLGLENPTKEASSLLESSQPAGIRAVALKKHSTATPAKRAYTQRELSGMPPDVRAEATGR